MNLRKLNFCSVLGIILCALPGCAAHDPLAYTVSTTVAKNVITPPSFDEQVAALPEGSMQHFTESPFGPVTIDAGPFYLSGLGNECRSAHITRGNKSHRLSLCRDKRGTWHFVPAIFESMPQ